MIPTTQIFGTDSTLGEVSMYGGAYIAYTETSPLIEPTLLFKSEVLSPHRVCQPVCLAQYNILDYLVTPS